MRFFAFDLDTTDGAHADLEEALRVARVRGAPRCATATTRPQAQEVIAAIEARPQRARLRPRRRRAAARRPQRLRCRRARASNSPRGALAFKYAAEEKTTVLADVDLGRRQDRQGRPGGRAGAGVRRRHDGHARDARQPGGHPRPRRAHRRHGARAPRRRRDPVRRRRARRVQAHRGRARDRAAGGVPVVRAAADRAGQQPRAVLHERRLPGPDRAAADPLGLARRGGHRGGRPGVDRAPQRGRAARAPVGLLRAHARAAAASSTASPTCRPTG